ncbi:MAG TPA: TetR/AcrR family transcriptional regulator [Solirubrobacterales bacterium]|nr:TetR/AcrR family transcriptional regulator [Solirubrobacterales bacterium]
MAVVASPDQLRRDARNNRAAILAAARALFADSADVAMCQVARRAGVGQATLYRNFPSRGALAAEILDEHVERIAALAAEHAGRPDAFFVLLRGLIDGMVGLYGLAVLARRDGDADSQLQDGRRRIAGLLEEPLADAKAAGTLRRDVTVDDVFLLLGMARGAMEGSADASARSAVAHRVLALILGGVERPATG